MTGLTPRYLVMSHQLKKQMWAKGLEASPQIKISKIQDILFLSSLLFLLSLTIGIIHKSFGLLMESLLIVTLAWGVYRRNFAATLILVGYLGIAKIGQMIFWQDLPLVFRIGSILLTILVLQRFYVGLKNRSQIFESEIKFFSLFDGIFVLMIGAASVSLSVFAIQWYG